MFKTQIHDKLLNIFNVKKVTFELPSEAKEQECIFIHVDSAVSKVTNGRAIAKVQGTLSIFANGEKLPFGFFHKKINSANIDDSANFFFYNMDVNVTYFGNLIERKASFVYFYNEQYDPNNGEINELNFSNEV
jgi:hypothetical protein